MNQNEPMFNVCESTLLFYFQYLRRNKMFADVKIKIRDLKTGAHRILKNIGKKVTRFHEVVDALDDKTDDHCHE